MKSLLICSPFIFFLFLAFASCKKDNNSSTEKTILTVLDSRSNTPIKDATVIFITNDGTKLFWESTTADGQVQVPVSIFNDKSAAMHISKDNYLTFDLLQPRSDKAFLSPLGWLRIAVRTNTTFSPGTFLRLEMYPEIIENMPSMTTVYEGLADDMVVVKGFGGQENTLKWAVLDGGILGEAVTFGSLNVVLPSLDTATSNVIVNY
jgi:hypothetical protein